MSCPEDFSVICRICLRYEKNLKSIFSTDTAEMLNFCQFLQVCENDGFPSQICSDCEELLTECYKFKQTCLSSLSTLKTIVEKSKELEIKQRILNSIECSTKTENSSSKTLTRLQVVKRPIKYDVEKKNRCRICNLSFTTQMELDTHNEIHSTNNLLKFDKDELTAFLNEEPAPPLAHKCNKCLQSFNEEDDLLLHESTHTSGELICIRCNKKFVTRQMLKRHIKIHLTNKPHVCQKCGKGYAESHALTKHLRRHMGIPRDKKHFCKECGQGFSEPFYLNVHMRKHTGERPLMCSICGKSFADPRSLKAHNMIHTGEKPFKCHICPKAFSQSVNLTKHIRVHTGEKPYICSMCGKSFTQSSSLDKHFRTHTGEKPYACDQCPKRFREKGTLIHHMRTHTKEKPYVCATCGQSFASSSELKVHDRKHTGLKRNVCKVCGKDFATPSNLLVHSRSHTGEKPFECVFCQRRFAGKGSLKKHHTKLHQQSSKTPDIESFVDLSQLNLLTEKNNSEPVSIALNDKLYAII